MAGLSKAQKNEIDKIRQLRDRGAFTTEEFEERLARVMNGDLAFENEETQPIDSESELIRKKFGMVAGGSDPQDPPEADDPLGDYRLRKQQLKRPEAAPSERGKPLGEYELRDGFSKTYLDELLTIKQLVELGLVDEKLLQAKIERLLEKRAPVIPMLKSVSTSKRRIEKFGTALTSARLLQRFSLAIATLGVISGIFLAMHKVETDCYQYGCLSTHPYWAVGIGVIINSIFAGTIFFAIGAYMEARLEQENN
jgi:hypothetical protein